MSERPAFDPSVYESPELAEINRPLHDLAWDNIEAMRAYRALSARDAGSAAAHERVMETQQAYEAAKVIADKAETAYLERRDAEREAAPIEPDDQPALI